MLSIVSVIIPCYNQAEFLPDALESVLSQTCSNWECIIISDGSTDNIAEVAGAYVAKDNRIYFCDTPNGGPSAARNFGISKAKGAYILPLDADDKISENYIEECIKMLQVDCSVKVVYGKGEKFGLKNERWNLKPYSWQKLLFGNMIHSCGMYRKKDWELSGGYDENILDGSEDWEYWIRLLKENQKAIMLTGISFYYRIKSISRTTAFKEGVKISRVNRHIYCKHADLYENYFIDPLKLFEEYKALSEFKNYVENNSFRFYCSQILKKFKIAGNKKYE